MLTKAEYNGHLYYTQQAKVWGYDLHGLIIWRQIKVTDSTEDKATCTTVDRIHRFQFLRQFWLAKNSHSQKRFGGRLAS